MVLYAPRMSGIVYMPWLLCGHQFSGRHHVAKMAIGVYMNEYEIITNMIINCPSAKLDKVAQDMMDAIIASAESNKCLIAGGFEFRLLNKNILDS